MSDTAKQPAVAKRELVRLRTTRVRVNVLGGLVILGLIVTVGHKLGVPTDVLTNISSVFGMLMMQVVRSDNKLTPETEPKK
ncbi:MAG: hypothetical protein OXB97_04620 [Rhodospirillales bacterium]|nr:hypothetical protein [Rhodospirillales bacterium]